MGDQHRRPSLSAVSPNASLASPPPSAFPSYSHADLYTVNSLNSFSFGNSSASASASSVSPLDDNTDDDGLNAFDITPRPSVADNNRSSHRSHPSQSIPGPSRRNRSSDAASHHTFGTSSTSASASSLSASDGIEFDDYMYYSDDDRIEISSVMYDASMVDMEERHYTQTPASSFASGYGERRVSLPIAVPEREREREGSVITLRRPSKSLGGDSPISSPTDDHTNEPNSVPESDGDWKSLRARTAKGKSKESRNTPPVPPVQVTTAPPITQDFDLDWSTITQGITSFEQPAFAAQSEPRRGSAGSIFHWTRRPSSATTASIFSNDDPFFRAVHHWAPDYREQRRAWTFSRERADGPALSPTSPTSPKSRSSLGDTSRFGITSRTSHRVQKEAWRTPANWKGMPVDSQEVWTNELVGRFKVDRRAIYKREENADISAKGPVHRLVVEHFRDGFTKGNAKHDEPIIMVHKHSKTVAFSISRWYKAKGRKMMSTNMILLAPRNVQEAYTSTPSTRKLESHGLLEDNRSKRRERPTAPSRSKNFDPQSSGGSVASSSSRPPSGGPPPPRRARRSSWDSDEDAAPPRTPHSEAYGTVDAALANQLRQKNQVNNSDEGGFYILRFFRTRRQEPPAQPLTVYKPGWMIMEPRNKQEQTQRVVENLNASFTEVGLLQDNKPHSTKKSKTKSSSRRTKDTGGETSLEVFREILPDVLYMLLPLWPSDTDPLSTSSEPMFTRPTIERQYLLVCYTAPPPQSKPTSKPTSKRTSPTSSSEAKEKDDKNILLPAFNITGRLVSHKDIQGSGMRVAEGTSVNGSLQQAYEMMPPITTNTTTQLIGICNSRESGVEFLPDGFVNLGLCMTYNAYPPGTIAEEAEAQGQPRPVIELTPIGKAVVEMAWVGGMAITSFGSA